MAKLLSLIISNQGLNFVSFAGQNQGIGGQVRYLNELFLSDPILYTLLNNHTITACFRTEVREVSKPQSLLRIRGRSPYIAGLTILTYLFRKKHRNFQRDRFPSWNRRRSFLMYGETQYYPRVEKTVNTVYPGFSAPPLIWDVKIPFSRYYNAGVAVDHIGYDDLLLLCKRLVGYVGLTFRRDFSLGRYCQSTFASLYFDDAQITYELYNVEFKSYPSGKWFQAPKLRINIQRGSGTAESVKVYITGLKSTVVNKDRSLGNPNFIPSASGIYHTSAPDPSLSRKLLLSMNQAFAHITMAKLAPALYHTQGKALNKILIDYSKNFENLVESPELLDMLNGLFSSPSASVSKYFGKDVSWYQRCRNLAQLLNGGILAWSFAIKPTIDAMQGIIKPCLIPSRGEGAMSFKGSDFASLPSGLFTLLSYGLGQMGHSALSVVSYDITFRSTATTTPDYVTLARALMDTNPWVANGVLPSPKAIWDTGKGSFVVDWFTPIGRTIADHQAYFSSPTMPFRIGHTMRCIIDFNDGRSVDLFYRSSESNLPIDPPGDSWLQAPGLPPVSIPLGVSVLLIPFGDQIHH
jgi:hypothetical protein